MYAVLSLPRPAKAVTSRAKTHTRTNAIDLDTDLLLVGQGLSGKQNSEGKESGKALNANRGIIREAKQMSMIIPPLRGMTLDSKRGRVRVSLVPAMSKTGKGTSSTRAD